MTTQARIKPIKGLTLRQQIEERTAELTGRLNAAHMSAAKATALNGELLEQIKQLKQEIVARDLLIRQLKQELAK